jgi:two-component system, sensor histidine kinase and response regulator
VTEQHQAEARVLQLSEKMSEEFAQSARQKGELQALLRAIPDLVWMKDTSGLYLSCNAAFEKLVGHDARYIIGKSDHELFPSELANAFRRDDLRAIKQGQALTVEEWVQYPEDGRKALLQTLKTPVHRPDGRALGVLGIARDITEMRALMDELQVARQLANEASQAKSMFLANMSHEIRTPMNAIIGMADLCLATPLNDRQHNYVRKIKSASDSLLHIINEILDFSKIEAGQLHIERIPFELETVLEQLSDVTALRAESQGIELTYDVEGCPARSFTG